LKCFAIGQTTDETTSHSAKPPKNGDQASGYSHLTDEATSQSTKSPDNGDQVAGYKLSKNDSKVIGYMRASIWSVPVQN
jgi:hypothetical protein